MKKISLLIALFFATLLLVGCGEQKEKNIEGTLDEILTKLYADFKEDEMPMLDKINFLEKMEGATDEEHSDRIKYYIGSDKIEAKEVLASEPMMSSIAYSVVLVRMEEKADIEKAKTEINNNVNVAIARAKKLANIMKLVKMKMINSKFQKSLLSKIKNISRI